jgi:phage recombination protein Bet
MKQSNDKATQLDIQVTGKEQRIVKETDLPFTEKEIAVIKNVAAKTLNDTQLVFFLKLSNSLGLNPFNKEAWAYQDNRGNLVTMAGRDGFLKIAQRSDKWNGIYSTEVREGEEFSIIFENGNVEIKHVKKAEKGQILGAFAFCKPKGVEIPTIEYVAMSDYNKGQFTWKSHPADMIKKVAEVHCLKKAYGITGLQSDYDFEKKGQYVEAIKTEQSVEDRVKQQIINKLDQLEQAGYKVSSYRDELQQARVDGKLTEQYLNEFLARLNDVEPKNQES